VSNSTPTPTSTPTQNATHPAAVVKMIDALIGIEGGYVNDPKDSGGATRWGVTERVARHAGYAGPMAELPRATAFNIYLSQYYIGPRFHMVAGLSQDIASELFEIEVNLPPGRAAGFLQRALVALNDPVGNGKPAQMLFPDFKPTGHISAVTLDALERFLKRRGKDGQTVLLRLINSQQACYYLDRAETRPANERFIYGWVLHRVVIESGS
jgi:lysozyme family protein